MNKENEIDFYAISAMYSAVFEAANVLKRGEKTEIRCPKCGGRMVVSKSGCNGHVWGFFQDCDVKMMQ